MFPELTANHLETAQKYRIIYPRPTKLNLYAKKACGKFLDKLFLVLLYIMFLPKLTFKVGDLGFCFVFILLKNND